MFLWWIKEINALSNTFTKLEFLTWYFTSNLLILEMLKDYSWDFVKNRKNEEYERRKKGTFFKKAFFSVRGKRIKLTFMFIIHYVMN